MAKLDKAKNTSITVLLGLLVGVALGTMFSRAYPTIEIESGLALLFAVVGLLIVLAVRALWHAIKRDKT